MKRMNIVILTVIATALLFSVSSVIYSKDRYRVQNVKGKVLKRNSTGERLTGSWSKVKRNQILSENTVLDIKPGGELRICDVRTSRIYKSQGDGRTNMVKLICEARYRASQVTNGVLRQMKGQEKKPKARYGRAGGVSASMCPMWEEEVKELDSIEATLIDFRVFHNAMREEIYNQIGSGNPFSNGLIGFLRNDSTGNVYLNVRNETSKGLFVSVFTEEHNAKPDCWLLLFRDGLYLPENCEIDLTEFPLAPDDDSTFLLLGAEDTYDVTTLQTLHFALPDSLWTKKVVSIIVPRLKIPDTKSFR